MSTTASPTSDGPLVRVGAEEIADFLLDHGQRHVFGVNGSNAVSVFRALADRPVRYVQAIHESAAVAMADGYARVAGEATVLLYMMQGTSSGLANLYNAWHDETPLLVLLSDQTASERNGMISVGEVDLPALVAPFARLARPVPAGSPLREWLERAHRAASGPATGPAVLAVPRDVLQGPVTPSQPIPTAQRVPTAPVDVASVVQRLAGARRPLLVVGGQVQRSGGAAILAELAERYAIPVAVEPGFTDRLSIPPWHPCSVGQLGQSAAAEGLAADADVVAVVGARFFCLAHPQPGQRYFSRADFIAHVNADPDRIEEGQLAHWACPASPAAFLDALSTGLAATGTGEDLRTARRERIAAARAAGATPPGPLGRVGAAMHDALQRGWLVDESTMSSAAIINALSSGPIERYLATTGATLGWGPAAACGAALASQGPVSCVIGDGALRFGLPGLWTAKAYGLPITYVVIDNSGYGSTGYFEREYLDFRGDHQSPAYVGSDLSRFDRPVAEVFDGFAIPHRSVAVEDDLRGAITDAWADAATGPNALVIDVGPMS